MCASGVSYYISSSCFGWSSQILARVFMDLGMIAHSRHSINEIQQKNPKLFHLVSFAHWWHWFMTISMGPSSCDGVNVNTNIITSTMSCWHSDSPISVGHIRIVWPSEGLRASSVTQTLKFKFNKKWQHLHSDGESNINQKPKTALEHNPVSSRLTYPELWN